MCLSSYGLDQSEKVINWKHTFPLLFSSVKEVDKQSMQWICGFHSDVAMEAFVRLSFALTAITLESYECSAFLPGKCKYILNMELAEHAAAFSWIVMFAVLPEYMDV